MTALTDRRVRQHPSSFLRSQSGRQLRRRTLAVAVTLTRSGTGAARVIAPAAPAQANLLTNGNLADGTVAPCLATVP
jgi:hypothetical protein